MSASILPSQGSGAADPGNRIRVALVEDRSGRRFRLSYRGETIPLEHSGSLNRWAATGIVHRHDIALSHDGVTIDGRTIRFEDPNAIAELEHVFNEQRTAPPPAIKPHKPMSSAPGESPGPNAELAKVANSVRVSRNGFEFHVTYLTKFGEHRTESLHKALDAFQGMHLFKPHVNLQKAGIRIVVTTWDGEHFHEEPGIENIEHASPAEVEAVIKAHMVGIAAPGETVQAAAAPSARKPVTRLELIRKPHEFRFHIIFHRSDGTSEEGPLLIRANLPKLAGEELFAPGITILITALNDRLIVERSEDVDGKPVKRTEKFEFITEDDAKKVEAALNACLRRPAEAAAQRPSPPPSVEAVAPSGLKEFQSHSSPPELRA